MPSRLASAAAFGSLIERTSTSQDEQAASLTAWIASSQTEHPALKISTLRFAMLNSPFRPDEAEPEDPPSPMRTARQEEASETENQGGRQDPSDNAVHRQEPEPDRREHTAGGGNTDGTESLGCKESEDTARGAQPVEKVAPAHSGQSVSCSKASKIGHSLAGSAPAKQIAAMP